MAARGIRNNNPGNIRRSGQKFAGEIESKDKNFKQFSSMAYGYRAMFRVITTYIKHRNVHRLDQIVTRWAPSQDDNDTATYINFVCGVTKFKPDRIIDYRNEADMRMLVSAMSQMENGVKAVKADVQAGWNLFISGK